MDRSSCGFRIYRSGDELRFEQARSGAFLALFVALLLVLIFAVNAVVQLVLEQHIAAAVLGGLGLVCVGLALVAYRLGVRRKAISPVNFVVHLRRGELHDAAGQRVCDASQLSWSTRFDPFDSTRGFMYYLEMRWPGAKAKVYKDGGCGGAPAELLRVRDEIVAQLDHATR